MNRITFPLKPGMQGAAVADLQDVLQLVLDRAVILANDEGYRRELSTALRYERAEQVYKDATAKTVSVFQGERGLRGDGEGGVDEPTADALNGLLLEWELLDWAGSPRSFVVSGEVRREDDLLMPGVRVRAVHKAEKGDIRLGEDITDAEGRYTIRYDPLPEVTGIHLRVFTLDDAGRPLQSSDVVPYAGPVEAIDLTVPMARRLSTEHRIEGRIILEHGLPAKQVKLRLYRRDFGGKATQLQETETLPGGEYAFTYDPGDQAVSFGVRALNDADEEVSLSKPLNDISVEPRTELNLIAPSTLRPLAAEYRRLSEDLTPHIGEMTSLAGAKENAEQQDLTVLNRATDWDARLIALAANAERLSADPEVGLLRESLYGLLRAGLPSEKLMLAQVGPDVAEQALKTARDAGIVELSDQDIGQFKDQFSTFATTMRLAMPAPGSRSTYAELLKTSGLSGDAQARFAPVYLSHQGDAAQLWDSARQAGLDDAQISKLQLQGKLAFLSGNSEAMTTRLLQRQIDDPVQLVEQDLHQADQWIDQIDALAGVPSERRDNLNDADKKALDGLIPPAFTAETVEARRELWAEDMARKVRLSYPTHVVGRMIEQDDADVFNLGAARPATAALLKNAAGQGFRLGETPAAAFLKTRPEIAADLPENDYQTAQQQMKTLQRVYQITTSNEAMPVMMNLGMTSAHDVMAYSEAAFLDLYNAKYQDLYEKSPKPDEPQLIYRKAKQVSSVIYNLFTIAKKLESDAPVQGMSGSAEIRKSARNELLKQFPTMESLFGSMDYCECEHCHSVLSPAAYLVDLLQFIDADPDAWGNFLAHWKMTHNNQEYTAKYRKPYDVLIERRPDIPNIPLTCENTNTALPYIDIVNEILEYYVANGKLTEDAAHDTGDATTEELLAEPQNVIREAYDKLREARYPLNLPFDLWIETVRQFCNYFETPLARMLDVFRPTDDLFDTTQPFDRSSIFIESLGLSPAEVAIFTNPDPLATWHELYGFTTPGEALTAATDSETGDRIDLNSAAGLSRRLGVTYQEIADIIQTGFVNPELGKLAILYKLGISIHDARFYLDNKALLPQDPAALPEDAQKRQLEAQAFADKLKSLEGTFGVSTATLESALQAIPFDAILVLADQDAGCDFDQTTVRYAGGKPVDDIACLKINLFVRLWRKLGWSIEETDRALQAFIPQDAPYKPANLAKQPLKTALIYLAHLKTLDETVSAGNQSRLKLLTLWSDIPTTGVNSLYAQLFLNRGVLRSDPVFDDPLGQYRSTEGIPVKAHLLALQGALNLTASEISRVLAEDGKSIDSAELSIPNISLLYRYGLLAKALSLSVAEVISLKQLSGINPFEPLHLEPLADEETPGADPPKAKKAIDFDYPFTQTLRFVEIAGEVKESGLKIEDLEYLLRHRFDETGRYRPSHDATLALLTTLAKGICGIHAEHAVPEDPGTMSDEVLRQKLGMALPADVVERFLAMMNGTVEFTATKTGVTPDKQLNPEAFTGAPAIRDVVYSETREEQKLTLRGVLFDAQKAELKARFPSDVFGALLDDVQQQAKMFFEKYLRKQAPDAQPAGGFLDDSDFDLLCDQSRPLEAGETDQDRLRSQQAKLANAFLPFLQDRLIRQLIIQTMTAYTAADPVLVESLITDKQVLACPTTLLDALAATSERGVTATFFETTGDADVPLATATVTDVDTGVKDKDGKTMSPATANGARFEGYLEVPEPGTYRFYVALDKKDAEATLRFDHLPNPVFLNGTASDDNGVPHDEPQEYVLGNGANEYLELKPGIAYRFTLDVHKLNGGEARLLVRGETLPKGSLAQLTLYPLAAMEGAERALVLLTKSLQLLQSLGLSEREIRYLSTHAADFGDFQLGKLAWRDARQMLESIAANNRATDSNLTEEAALEKARSDNPGLAIEADQATPLFEGFLRLAGYASLKRDLAGGTDDLIGIFEANGTKKIDNVYPLIAKLTRRDESIVRAVANALYTTPVFASEEPMKRLWEALQVAERFGVPVSSILEWTGIVGSAATVKQRFEIARDLREAIKARFTPETWQRVAQPIFDKLRQYQRDALVSHVMHEQSFASINQLYEYFLIDPGMEPVVQTSRIRLAIASLQLFIQRCLLNLEKQVPPSVIDAGQWEWMKRYRVWEADRKIFLFPENWLEPEFRDDKTHLFTALEGALLQGDVSNDLVEDAFLAYLQELDKLARLDIVAMHLEDKPDPAQNVLHVIGRTYSTTYKYFYRRYAQEIWTPWEPVTAEIEGDHLAPVVWRDRLYLFWVTFLAKTEESAGESSSATIQTVHAVEQFAQAPAITSAKLELNSAYVQNIAKPKEPSLADMTLSQVTGAIMVSAGMQTIEVQLHWSEYLHGEWSTRESGGFDAPNAIVIPGLMGFNSNDVFIHISKEPGGEDGAEGGVYIHLGGKINKAFYLAGRNSAPESTSYSANGTWGAKPANPYKANTPQATRYSGSGALLVEFKQRITTEPGKSPTVETPSILRSGGKFTLLPCDNNITLGTPDPSSLNATNPDAVAAAIQSGLPEIASLMKPVFYQNNAHTLFIEPNVTEQTIEEWQDWVTRTPRPEANGQIPDWLKYLEVVPAIPKKPPIPDLIDPWSTIKPKPGFDWLTNPGTGLLFDGDLIGPAGRAGVEIRPAGTINGDGQPVNVNPGSALASAHTLVLTEGMSLEETGLTAVAGGLNVVGGAGFNPALKQNFDALNR